MKAAAMLSTILLAAACPAAAPKKDGKKTERKGPLKDLPSKPGPHVAKVKALSNGQWVNLGSPAPDPRWGKARGRSWCARMPKAPGLRGAYLLGTGVHGFIKPDGRYMNDVWFYDLNAHRWVCIFPGLNTRTLVEEIRKGEIKVNERGLVATRDGEEKPFFYDGHTWARASSDTHGDRLVFCNGWIRPDRLARHHRTRMKWAQEAQKLLVEQAAGKELPGEHVFNLSFYDPYRHRWEQHLCRPGRARGTGHRVLRYVSSRKQFFWSEKEGTAWFYDPAKRKWSTVGPKGIKPEFGIDCSACYDHKRDRLYMGGGLYPPASTPEDSMSIYDLKTGAWLRPRPKNSQLKVYTNLSAAMHYDSVNDVVVVISRGRKDKNGVFVYDPGKNEWLPRVGSLPRWGGGCINAFYDAELNAHYVHVAGDSRDNGTMWVYRYKRANGKK